MSKYQLKPGIIHIKDKAISPFVHLDTVYMDGNSKLNPYLDELYQRYKDRNIPTYEYVDFSITKDDWEYRDGIYKVNIGKLSKEDYRLYNITTILNLSVSSTVALISDPMYKFIKVNIDEDNIVLYCNILPVISIIGTIVVSWIYNLEIEKGIPKNLEVELLKEQFIKVNDMRYMYKVRLPELDSSLNYNISYTFDVENIQKFLASYNRYITVEYNYGEAIIYTEFPFTAKILLIINIKE